MSQVVPKLTRTPSRLAAIDIGTNSIRLIVVEAWPDGTYRLIDDEKEVTRLGKGMVHTGELSSEAIDASVEVIRHMKEIADSYDISMLRVIATCAVREATNGHLFIEKTRDLAGVQMEVISPDEEGRLAYLSVRNAFDLRSMNSVVADLGGGSTELVFVAGGDVHEIQKLPLGAVRLTEQCESEQNVTKRLKSMRRCVRGLLRDHVSSDHPRPQVIFGTGGTFTTLANIAVQRHNVESESMTHPFTIRGFEMKRAEVQYLSEWLASMPQRTRVRVPGLNPDRADIIVAGATIVYQLMKYLRADTLRVHDRGIRDGLLLTMIRELYPRSASLSPAPDRMHFVRQLASACNDVREHSEQVTNLALQIYDQLVEKLASDDDKWAKSESRELLRYGAMLHDIGHSINYTRHHKHSYHLIIHSEMPGFTHRELEIVANIARYHRRAAPKVKHPGFEKLTPEDREIVTRLAAILRIADGLDRAHARFVDHVTVELRDGTAWFLVHADADPIVDRWGAAKKCQFFHRVFGLDSRFEWAGMAAQGTRTGEGHENATD